MRTSGLAGILLAVGLGTSQAAVADTWPEKPITIVVPVAPGGTVDMVARLVAQGLSDEVGQPVIVENKAGASGTIGTRHVARSAPDGYTLLAIANTFASVPEFMPEPGYDALKDFAPITQTCSIPMVLVMGPSSPDKTLSDFVARARAHPGEIALGSSGLGSTGYIAAHSFGAQADIDLMDVYYKGNSQALLDVMSGNIAGMFDQVSTAGPNIKTHKLHALAVTTRSRSPMLPDVPTIAESGFPDFEDETFNALVAPAGTPESVIARVHQAVSRVLAQASLRERLAKQGIEAKPSRTPEDFGRYLEASVKKYRTIAAGATEKK